jgi:glycerol uptake facilitator-like aquaporin
MKGATMNLPPLARKMLAEFIGTAVFLTAIVYSTDSMILSITLGLMVLLVSGISGGYLNPVMALYFFSRKELSALDFVGQVVAQLAGAAAGVFLGAFMHGYKVLGFGTAASSVDSAPAFVGEALATAGLALLIIMLLQNKLVNVIPFAIMLWVFAASNFTPTGAQANPAVTFGLMVYGKVSVSSGATLVLAQIVGLLVAVILSMLLTSATAKKKAAAKKK